jgi:hypothetical protein
VTNLHYPPPTDRAYYLAGPISGDMVNNIAKFTQAAVDLRERGYDVTSPIEIHDATETTPETAKSWDYYLRMDIGRLVRMDIEGIIMLPGWEHSKGAQLELYIANQLNYTVTTLGECLVRPVRVTLDAPT